MINVLLYFELRILFNCFYCLLCNNANFTILLFQYCRMNESDVLVFNIKHLLIEITLTIKRARFSVHDKYSSEKCEKWTRAKFHRDNNSQ